MENNLINNWTKFHSLFINIFQLHVNKMIYRISTKQNSVMKKSPKQKI